MKSKILAILAASSLAIPASANAADIYGSISLNGFIDSGSLPSGSASVVSQLMTIVSLEPAFAGAGFGDYAGSGGAITPVNTIDLGVVPPGTQPLYTFADGTVFSAQILTDLVRNPLVCVNGTCEDSLGFSLFGQVSRAGFDDTFATVNWFGQGSCPGGGDPYTCTGDPTALWSATLVSPTAADVPQPGSLALLGLGLAGLGLSRRRKAN